MDISANIPAVLNHTNRPIGGRRRARRIRPFAQVVDLQWTETPDPEPSAADVLVPLTRYDYQGAVRPDRAIGKMIDAVA